MPYDDHTATTGGPTGEDPVTTEPNYASIAQDIRAALTAAGLDPEDHAAPLALHLGGPDLATAISARALAAALYTATDGAYREDPDGEYGPSTITDALKAHPDRAVRWLGGLLAEMVETFEEAGIYALTEIDTGAEAAPERCAYCGYRLDGYPNGCSTCGACLDAGHPCACSETGPTYAVYRFYLDDTPTERIATGLTLDEARAHCQRPDTAGPGWFDGFDVVIDDEPDDE